jgi:hypothetical protein
VWNPCRTASNLQQSDQRLLTFHYGVDSIEFVVGWAQQCDQRLLAFHYGVERVLKLLSSEASYLVLQVPLKDWKSS